MILAANEKGVFLTADGELSPTPKSGKNKAQRL